MNKKKVKFILIIIGSTMVLTILYYMFTRVIKNPFVRENAIKTNIEKQIGSSDSSSDDNEEQWALSSDGQVMPVLENLKEIGEKFTVKNEVAGWELQFQINDVIFTKEAVDSDAVYAVEEDASIQLDDSNNILNDYTYIMVNVTIVNMLEQEVNFPINSFRYITTDVEQKDIIQTYYSGALRGYKTRSDQVEYDKDYAKVLVAPKAELNYNLVFVQQDSDIEHKIPYLKLWPSGAYGYEENTCYVMLSE